MTTVVTQERGINLLIRAIYFLLFGLWFSGVWAVIAWVLCITIIGLPFGLWMLNRLPQVSTLRPQQADLVITHDGRVYQRSVRQLPFVIRAMYFLLVGWWLSGLWLAAAWALCSVIIGLPFGFWMLNRVPAVITLAQG